MRKLSPQNKPKVHLIDGEEHTFLTVMKIIQQSMYTAKQRLKRYNNGEITKDQLFHVGALPIGGYNGDAGNDEWRSLQDRRPRTENLVSPSPTKYDKKYSGVNCNERTTI